MDNMQGEISLAITFPNKRSLFLPRANLQKDICFPDGSDSGIRIHFYLLYFVLLLEDESCLPSAVDELPTGSTDGLIISHKAFAARSSTAGGKRLCKAALLTGLLVAS